MYWLSTTHQLMGLLLIFLGVAGCTDGTSSSGEQPSAGQIASPAPSMGATQMTGGEQTMSAGSGGSTPVAMGAMGTHTGGSGAPPMAGSSPSGSGSVDAGLTDQGGPGAMPKLDGGIGNVGDMNAPANAARRDALTDAYAALTRGDRSSLPSIVAAIDAQSAANPDDRYAVFYAGVFRLWGLAEGGDITGAPGVIDNLERAHELLPDDFRVTGFYGMSQVMFGSLTDPQALDTGLEVLALAVKQQSAYGHFLRATAVSGFPADDPNFKIALTDLLGFGQDCVMPDSEGIYHYPTNDEPSRSRVCNDESIVPHVWEGYFLTAGDIALKTGWDATKASALYRSVQTSPHYETWPFKAVLEQRIADAEANAAAYADGNPLNDPATWVLSGNICVGCHQANE